MSRLYASIDSDARKTQAMSRGHKYITTHTRGWNTGVEVDAYVTDDDRDAFRIYATSGSNGGTGRMFLGIVIDAPSGPQFMQSMDT